MSVGIKIGTDLKTVEAATKTVMAILEANADQKTKREAFRVFGNLCSVTGAAVSNCCVTMQPDNDSDED